MTIISPLSVKNEWWYIHKKLLLTELITLLGTEWASSPEAGAPEVAEASLARPSSLGEELVWDRVMQVRNELRWEANLYLYITGSSYSSEAEEGAGHGSHLDDSRQSSNNTSPSHTLAGHAQAPAETSQEGQSNSIWYDEFDSSGLEPEKKKKALDVFQSKMNKTKDQIKQEQNSRDANVDEYLR